MKPISYDVYTIQNTDFVVKEEQAKYRFKEVAALKLEQINPDIRQKLWMIQADKKDNKHLLRKRKWFMKITEDDLRKLYKLDKTCSYVLQYLIIHVNRLKMEHVWADLGKYKKGELLATARTQTRIASDTKLDRPQVSKAIAKLKKQGLIVEVSEETVTIGGKETVIPIYALGFIEDFDGDEIEVFFYEALLEG